MIETVTFKLDGSKLVISSGPYRGDIFGLIDNDAHGYKVIDHTGQLDFYCSTLTDALTWAAGNAYRYVAHRNKNG